MTVSGNQGDWVEFTHTLGPDPASLHPVKVWSQDYASLKGVGKYATDFGQGTASYDMFGDGPDGPLTIAVDTTDNPLTQPCIWHFGITASPATNAGFAPGQVMPLIHQTQGANAGTWMQNGIAAYSAGHHRRWRSR